MLKVLIIGPDFYMYQKTVQKAFELYHCQTKLFNTNMGIERHELIPRLRNRLNMDNSSIFEQKMEHFSKAAWDIFMSFAPDIVLVIKGNAINKNTINLMRQLAKTILWIMDSVSRFPDLIDLASVYDQVYVFENSDVEILSKRNIQASFLPVGFDDSVYYPLRREKTVDVSFVGNMYPYRREMLRRLIRDHLDLKFEFYGGYVSKSQPIKYLSYLINNEKRAFVNKGISHYEANELYNRSQICLNIHHQQSKDGWNPRTNEILGAGGFQLVDENIAIRNEFKGCVVLYNGYYDLKQKIQYYLKHEKERDEIARKGHLLALAQHTFKHRVKRILDDLESNK